MEFFIYTGRARAGSAGEYLPFDENKFRDKLEKLGDSVIVIADNDAVKVHIHSKSPGEVLNEAIRYGELSRIHILNMRDQHRELLAEEAPTQDSVSAGNEEQGGKPRAKPYGIVAVAAGNGIADIFRSLGVDAVLSGGQTMNPSTEDIVNAIRRVGAETVFVLPNNSNIILAAEQAKELAQARMLVIPTKTIPQGLAAALAFRESADPQTNLEAMRAACEKVRSGQVTYAVRDSRVDGLDIKKGDYLGILDNRIVASGPDLAGTCEALFKEMLVRGDEVLTILAGEEANEETTRSLADFVREQYPDVEIEVHFGGQPLYTYIFSAE